MNPTQSTPRPSGQGPEPLRPQPVVETRAAPKQPKRRRRRVGGDGNLGGRHRHRTGGSMRAIGGGRWLVPEDLLRRAGSFRFPIDKATPEQIEALDGLLSDYLQRDLVYRLEANLPAASIGAALGMSERKAAYLVAEVRRLKSSPVADLVLAVLLGMATGKIAGVLGTRHNQKTRYVLGMVDRVDLTEEIMRDRLSIGDDGEWADDDEYRRNCRLFTRLQSAFRLDYLQWRDK